VNSRHIAAGDWKNTESPTSYALAQNSNPPRVSSIVDGLDQPACRSRYAHPREVGTGDVLAFDGFRFAICGKCEAIGGEIAERGGQHIAAIFKDAQRWIRKDGARPATRIEREGRFASPCRTV
jgi:hypothetical protein